MKSNKSIWLSEYEGLLPIEARDCQPSSSREPDSRAVPDHEALSPHSELMPTHLTRTTPTAFFE